jgi:hypothetical protein
MIKKSITFFFVLLMVSSIFMTPQTINTSTLDYMPVKENQVAETDLSRVTLEADIAKNGDLEDWNTPKYPEGLYTDRTVEKATWIETTIVNEGSQSVGMHARSLDGFFVSEVRLTQQQWIYWDNPINTTLDLDWYLDEIGTPLNSDYFRMQVRMSSRNIYYYIGSQTTSTNSTSTGYIMIDGPTQTWNHLHRNLSSDYFEVFGFMPTQFELIHWWVYSETTEYTRVYMDDVNLVNGTYIHVGGSTLNGNFEGGGGWTFQSNSDPADITQSSLSHGGSWSMNMTSISYDYSARAQAHMSLEKLLSPLNHGQLSFYWRIDDWVNPTTNTYASVRVSVANTTTSLTMHYFLCVGGAGTLPMIVFGDDMKFQVTDFNVTNTWNHFNRNIWEDFHIYSNTHDLYLESFSFYVLANEDDSSLSVLFDDISFTSVLITDMGYETQGSIGTPVEGWTEPIGYDTFTVTDFAANGDKAGNITLEDDRDFYADQEFGDLEVNSDTELIFDFNVYIDTFNQTSSDDFIYFEFGFGDDEGITYILANVSAEVESWMEEGSHIIYLQETIVTGEWMNFQLDLVHDYEAAVGSLPDTILEEMYLVGLASKSSTLVVYLDDLYLYYDSEPGISDIRHEPAEPLSGEVVTVSATVVDATLESVDLYYRISNGTWMSQRMTHVGENRYESNITELTANDFVEYYIIAEDAFGFLTHAMDGGNYYSFTVGVPPQGFPLLPIIAVVVIAAIGVIIILYMFVYKKKE